MNEAMIEKAVFDALKNKDWDRAFDHARALPANWDVWQRMPHAAPLPDHFVHKVLDFLGNKQSNQHKNLSSFLFEFAKHTPGGLMGNWKDPEHAPTSSETLNRLMDSSLDLSLGGHYETNSFKNHPAYTPSKQHELLSGATHFWQGYEMSVQPHHFAVIKSIYTGKPETLDDHRGRVGDSTEHMHLIPGLLAHAKEVQRKVMEDNEIPKRYFRGEPHIQLHRGVNGHYGKLIRDKARYDVDANEADKKRFIIPVAHMSSWTTSPEMARSFAWDRGQIQNQPGDQGVVMTQWVPVKNLLHSGFHRTEPSQVHHHESELELVVGHPQGKYKISTAEMEFQEKPKGPKLFGATPPNMADNYGKTMYPNLRKSEFEVETVDMYDIMAEVLNKNVMKKLVPAATALAIIGAPQEVDHVLPQENMPASVQQVTDAKPVQSIQRMPPSPASGLKPIKMIESSLGSNVDHKMMTTGPHAGTSAYGSYGLMPMTIVEVANKNPSLLKKYPGLKGLDYRDNNRVHQTMKQYPQAEVDIANAHWNRLRNVFDDNSSRMAYAWLNGVTSALKTPESKIHTHPYVQKYKKFRRMMELEKKYEDVKKSALSVLEDKGKGDFADVSKFIPFTDIMQNHRHVRDINEAIKAGQVHDLSNVGKFTHSSFVAGFDPDNSWLIKLEPFGSRPGIESVSHGLQTVKEAAFYYIANRIFDLGIFTPQAILGEVVKDKEDETIPAVAIKMYPQPFVSAVDMNKTRPGSVKGILEKYRRTGDLHKMAMLLYVLGDADSHGNNILTDGSLVKLIDHGSSFGNMEFDPANEKNVFVPYFLRSWGYRDDMTPDQKYQAMPKIDNEEVENEVKHWLMSLSKYDMSDMMKKFYLDPQPAIDRLEKLQDLAKQHTADAAINLLWTKGME